MPLNFETTALAVIDVQGKLAGIIHDHERVVRRIANFIRISEAFGLPIFWSEQAPDKIGETVEPIKNLLYPIVKPVHKRSFSCYDSDEYVKHLSQLNRRQILITGIETHVCVYQTARDLNAHGYEVHLVADAVASRHERDTHYAIERMRQEGITITTAEMAMCELLKTADNPKFKEIMKFFKGE